MSLEDRRKLENKIGIRGFDEGVSQLVASAVINKQGKVVGGVVDGRVTIGEAETDLAAARMVMYRLLGPPTKKIWKYLRFGRRAKTIVTVE